MQSHDQERYNTLLSICLSNLFNPGCFSDLLFGYDYDCIQDTIILIAITDSKSCERKVHILKDQIHDADQS